MEERKKKLSTMVTTPYILANCTMQQSVNGNIKHKIKLVTTKRRRRRRQEAGLLGHLSGELHLHLMCGSLLHQLRFKNKNKMLK